jgi:hypothetical protein
VKPSRFAAVRGMGPSPTLQSSALMTFTNAAGADEEWFADLSYRAITRVFD